MHQSLICVHHCQTGWMLCCLVFVPAVQLQGLLQCCLCHHCSHHVLAVPGMLYFPPYSRSHLKLLLFVLYIIVFITSTTGILSHKVSLYYILRVLWKWTIWLVFTEHLFLKELMFAVKRITLWNTANSVTQIYKVGKTNYSSSKWTLAPWIYILSFSTERKGACIFFPDARTKQLVFLHCMILKSFMNIFSLWQLSNSEQSLIQIWRNVITIRFPKNPFYKDGKLFSMST